MWLINERGAGTYSVGFFTPGGAWYEYEEFDARKQPGYCSDSEDHGAFCRAFSQAKQKAEEMVHFLNGGNKTHP